MQLVSIIKMRPSQEKTLEIEWNMARRSTYSYNHRWFNTITSLIATSSMQFIFLGEISSKRMPCKLIMNLQWNNSLPPEFLSSLRGDILNEATM